VIFLNGYFPGPWFAKTGFPFSPKFEGVGGWDLKLSSNLLSMMANFFSG
jgi:hypothetical protein